MKIDQKYGLRPLKFRKSVQVELYSFILLYHWDIFCEVILLHLCSKTKNKNLWKSWSFRRVVGYKPAALLRWTHSQLYFKFFTSKNKTIKLERRFLHITCVGISLSMSALYHHIAQINVFSLLCWIYFNWILNPFQGGGGVGGQKGPPYQFSPVTSTNVRISPQNFLTFSFNAFGRLVQNLKFIPSASPKLFNLNLDDSSKAVFLIKSLYNWGYDNFFCTNARVTKLWSHDSIHNIIWDMWQNFVCDAIGRI